MNSPNIPLNLNSQVARSSGSQPTKTNSSPNPGLQSAQSQQQKLLDQSIRQRQAYKAMESSAPNPIQDHAKQRGEMLERRIRQLQQVSGNNS